MPFGNIYIGGLFLGSREGEKRQRPQNATQVAVCHCSEHHAVHWMSISALSALLPRTRDRSAIVLGKCGRIVCGVSSYNLCSTAESNRQE